MAGQYNPYAAGPKKYGGGRSNPTSGPVDPLGYKDRDARKRNQNAALRALKAQGMGAYGSADYKRVM